MSKNDIRKYYKNFGYINLILSILSLFFIKEIGIIERIIALIVMNLGYHIIYSFFNSLYGFVSHMRTNNKFNKIGGGFMLKFMSISGILASFLFIYVLISDSLFQNDYQKLFIICIPVSIFLGAYSLWIEIKNE